MDAIGVDIRQRYIKEVFKFKSHEAFGSGEMEIKNYLEIRKKEVLENNKKALLEITQKARWRAKNRLVSDVNDYYLPWTFGSHARDVIASELAGTNIPDSAVVVNNFVDEELSVLYAQLPVNNFTMSIFIGFVVAIVLFIFKNKK